MGMINPKYSTPLDLLLDNSNAKVTKSLLERYDVGYDIQQAHYYEGVDAWR